MHGSQHPWSVADFIAQIHNWNSLEWTEPKPSLQYESPIIKLLFYPGTITCLINIHSSSLPSHFPLHWLGSKVYTAQKPKDQPRMHWISESFLWFLLGWTGLQQKNTNLWGKIHTNTLILVQKSSNIYRFQNEWQSESTPSSFLPEDLAHLEPVISPKSYCNILAWLEWIILLIVVDCSS